MPAIGFNSFSVDPVAHLVDGQARLAGNDVPMASGQASALTPTSLHPPGTVLVKKTSGGKYYLATDQSNGDRNTPASVATLVTNPGSGGWDGDVVIKGHWGSLTVTLSGANTDADVAAAIIAAIAAQNPESKARVTAADTTGEVTFTNLDSGPETWLSVHHATVTAMFGAAGASTTFGYPTNADYRVTDGYARLADIKGTAQDFLVPTLKAGHFRLSALSNLTPEAKAVLASRGSIFSA